MSKIYIKKIENIVIPKKASEVAAGHDIIATSDPKIVGIKQSDKWKSIDYIEYETNLYIAPSVVALHTLIHPRSSISKYNLVLANGVGLVDNDYRGMVICRFKYIFQPEDIILVKEKFGLPETDEYEFTFLGKVNIDKIYDKGDAIAQLVFEPTVNVNFELVDDLDKTKRGDGGFGSTDIKIQQRQESSLTNLYNKTGGIQIKEKYTEEIKKREL